METADPMLQYAGIAGGSSLIHQRWNLTEAFNSLNQSYQAGYTEGHDAGSVTVSAVMPQLGGTMYFGSVAGERQVANKQLPFQGSLSLTLPNGVVIGQGSNLTSTSLVTPGTLIRGQNFISNSQYQTILSADALSRFGLSSLNITSNDLLVTHNPANDAANLPDLRLAAGGSFSVNVGGAIDIAGRVSAAGGTISLLTDRFAYRNNNTLGGWFRAPTAPNGGAEIVRGRHARRQRTLRQ
ncbi:hypothetical protein ES703_110220 [subsurface metagenome]